jgi:hypothetical protein
LGRSSKASENCGRELWSDGTGTLLEVVNRTRFSELLALRKTGDKKQVKKQVTDRTITYEPKKTGDRQDDHL